MDSPERATSQAGQKLRQAYTEAIGNQLECGKADVLLAALHVRQVTAVNAEPFGHLDLSPSFLDPKVPKAFRKLSLNLCGHAHILRCRL